MKFNLYYSETKLLDINDFRECFIKEVEVPHTFETNDGNNLEVKNLFYSTKLENAKGKFLCFEGVAYACNVYVNNEHKFYHEGAWDKFAVELDGDDCEVIVEVIRTNFDKDSDYFFRKTLYGFIPDITMPFSGIYGKVTLCDSDKAFLNVIKCENNRIISKNSFSKAKLKLADEDVEFITEEETVIVRNPRFWTPNNPVVYDLILEVDGETQEHKVSFVDFKFIDNKMYFSDEMYYMKGILHWGYYPEYINPFLPYEEAREEICKIKELGFNTIKLCLFFPPSYYYDLCMEFGIVLWQEYPLWLPTNDQIVERRLLKEISAYNDIIAKYSNVVIVTIGCELDGTMNHQIVMQAYYQTKEFFKDRRICDNSGSNECFAGTDIIDTDFYDYHFYGELNDLEQLFRYFGDDYRQDKPFIFGEFNDSDSWRTINFNNTWWQSGDPKVNLLLKSHEGFASGTNMQTQKKALDNFAFNLEKLTSLSLIKSYQYRKNVLDMVRLNQKIQGYNITTLRDVAITTSGIFDDQMNLKYPSEQMRSLLAPKNVVIIPALRRKWINGGDIFYKRDMYNVILGEVNSYKVLFSNQNCEIAESKIEIMLNDEIIYETNYASKYQISSIVDLAITFNQLGKNVIKVVVDDVVTEYIVNVFASDKADYILFEQLDNQTREKVVYCQNAKRVELEKFDKSNLFINFIDRDGDFKLTKGPFWREGVIYSSIEMKAIDQLNPIHLNNVIPKYYVNIEDIDCEYEKILSRIDSRKFFHSEYIFKVDNVIYVCLDFKEYEKESPILLEKQVIMNNIINELGDLYE